MAEGGVDIDFGRDEQQEVRKEEDDNDAVFDEEIDPNLDGLTQETTLSEVQSLDTGELNKNKLGKIFLAFYEHIQEETGYEPTFNQRTPFRIDNDNGLSIKWKNKWVKLTDKRNPNIFLKLSTIQNRLGVRFVREGLGFTDYVFDNENVRSA